jgi:hypothetical protein
MNVETIVEAARLTPISGSEDSCYLRVGSYTIRVSGHARQSHHAAADLHRAADINVLILDAAGAEDFAAWRIEAPREVSPAEVIVRTKGQRATVTARRLRAVLARVAREMRALASAPPPSQSGLAGSWEGEKRDCECWASKVPPRNTLGRKSVVLALRAAAIQAGIDRKVAARQID